MEGEDDNTGKDEETKEPISKTIYEYADVATTHGIYYIFEAGRLVFERVFWIIVVILALIFAIGLSVSAYDNWKANPVLTSVGTTGYPIERVTFPSITICPQGSAYEIVDTALFVQFDRYLRTKNKIVKELSNTELMGEGKAFLDYTYPGATQAPTQMIRMLGSPGMSPDKSLDAEAVLNPEDEKKCKYVGNMECPEGFITVTNSSNFERPCWKFEDPTEKRSKYGAIDYCQNLIDDDEWRLFTIQQRQDWSVLWDVIDTGK